MTLIHKQALAALIVKDASGCFACPCEEYSSSAKWNVERHMLTCKTVKMAATQSGDAAR